MAFTLDSTNKNHRESSKAQIFQYFQITPLIIIEYVAVWYLNIEYFGTDQLIGPYSAFIKTILYLIIIILHLVLIFTLIICTFKGFVSPLPHSYDAITMKSADYVLMSDLIPKKFKKFEFRKKIYNRIFQCQKATQKTKF